MRFAEIVERYSSLIFISGLIIGVLTDSFSRFEFLVPFILGFVMFLSFLKIDYKKIVDYMKRPSLLFFISFIQMILFPILFYLFFKLINEEFAIAVLLLVALPSAVFSPVLANMFKGETNLSVVLVILNHIVSVFSIPFLFYLLIGRKLSIDVNLLALSLFELIIIPLVLAAIVLYKYNDRVKRIDPYLNSIAIIGLFFITIFALSPHHSYIFQNLLNCMSLMLFQFLIFLTLLIIYLVPMKLKKEERRTVTITKSFMNNMLGVVIALKFFSPYYLVFMVLTGVPWILMLLVSKRIYTESFWPHR